MDQTAQKIIATAPPKSEPYYSSNLNMSSVPFTDVSIIHSEYAKIFSSFPLDNLYAPVDIHVLSSPYHYVDLASSFFEFKCKLTTNSGGTLPASTNIVPVNDLFHALWSGVEVIVNNVQISKGTSLYPYRAHIQRTLASTQDQKNSVLKGEWWYPEDKCDVHDANTSSSFKIRKQLSSKEFTLTGRISDPFLNQAKYLFPGNDLRIRLHRTPNKFYLEGTLAANTTLDAKLTITHACFYAKKLIVSPEIHKTHMEKLSRGEKFIYPVRNVDINTYVIPSGTKTHSIELFQSQVPELFILSFLNSEALVGVPSKTPFCFKNHDLLSATLQIDSEHVLTKTLTFDVANKDYMIAYNDLIKINGEKFCGITPEDFIEKNFFLAFNIFPTLQNRLHLERSGQLKITLNFRSELTEGVTLMVYMQTQGTVKLDANRNVYLDYAV